MPRRRERVLGFDRMTGIEIADLADRLMEVWPDEAADRDGVEQARGHIDALQRSADVLAKTVVDLRAELARVERGQEEEVSAVAYTVDPRVDAYIDALPDWQQSICRQVRDLVHSVDPEVVETIKRTDRPYFVLEGNICALLAAKTHVNVFLYDGAIVPDPKGIITGGHDNKTARTVAIRRDETINAPALAAMFKQIIANNRAGGWRKLKRDG